MHVSIPTTGLIVADLMDPYQEISSGQVEMLKTASVANNLLAVFLKDPFLDPIV